MFRRSPQPQKRTELLLPDSMKQPRRSSFLQTENARSVIIQTSCGLRLAFQEKGPAGEHFLLGGTVRSAGRRAPVVLTKVS